MATPRPAQPQRFPSDDGEGNRNSSLLRRSWHVMSDILSPFSPSAVASLPNVSRPQRYTRADGIPEELEDEGDERPLLRDYHAINGLPPHVRIPKKISTPVKVESKVWFANERSALFPLISCSIAITELFSAAWVSWLNLSVLLGTLSMALFNASGDNVARYFAYTYAIISIGVLVRIKALGIIYDNLQGHVMTDLWLLALPASYHHD